MIKLACLICRLVNQYFINLSQKTASARLFSLFAGKYILTFALLLGIGINVFNDVASIAGEIKDPPARLADLVRDCPSLHAVMGVTATFVAVR